MTDLPLAGFRIGVTAARRAEEQIALLQRRGASVVHAPALALVPDGVADADLRATTEEVLARPVDVFVGTTGVGLRAWFAAAEQWGLLDELIAHLRGVEILARGPKTVGALRRNGLREAWSPASEAMEDVLARLHERDLRDQRIVVQEHGQSLSPEAASLREAGADVTTVAIYRVEEAVDRAPLDALIAAVVAREVDAVTFTAAPAVVALLDAAEANGQRDAVLGALRTDVLVACVGPVTAAALEPWGVPSIQPERSRTAAMIRQLELDLPRRRTS